MGCNEYMGIDIAEDAVSRAVERLQQLRPPLNGDCMCLDVLTRSFKEYTAAVRPFTTTSCQFALHYAFDTEDHAHHIISCIASSLVEGGSFIGTVPDAEELCKRRERLGKKFGDRFFKVAFNNSPPGVHGFGDAYTFTLRGAVDSLQEYVVHKEIVESIANTYGLQLTLWENLYTFTERESESNPNRYAIFRGALHDVTRLYVAFKFVKCCPSSASASDCPSVLTGAPP
jgi:mRNA (guanine-N7-)-methyltransferase